MEKSAWICISVSRTLRYDDDKAITRELSIIFGSDLLGYKVVCNDDIVSSGEYYMFVHCNNYWDHAESLGRCHFITGVVPSREAPHSFSSKEISEFLSSVGHKDKKAACIHNGDVVLIKRGYLKGLYGIVIKELTNKKCKVFFSFYVRQFNELLPMASMEFIGKVSGYEFPSGVIGKPLIIGAQVVHRHQLYREEGRRCLSRSGRRKGSAIL